MEVSINPDCSWQTRQDSAPDGKLVSSRASLHEQLEGTVWTANPKRSKHKVITKQKRCGEFMTSLFLHDIVIIYTNGNLVHNR